MSRGTTVKTPELVAEAIRLRAEGLTHKEIADRFGVAKTTAHAWVSDPDGVRARARKDACRRECVDCGGPAYGVGRQAAQRCDTCARRKQTADATWTRETIPAAIVAWTAQHGRQPTARDWLRGGSTHPASSTVLAVCGSWLNAIRAAGFTSLKPGNDAALCQEIAGRYAAGESTTALAREYGCRTDTIIYRARKAGAAIRPARRPRRMAVAA